MASAHPTATNSVPQGAAGGARPNFPTPSMVTLGPPESWEDDGNKITGQMAVVDHYTFKVTQACSGASGESMYSSLNGLQDWGPGQGRSDPTAPQAWSPAQQGTDWLLRDLSVTRGEGGLAPVPSRPPNPAVNLDAISWALPPRTWGTDPQHMAKLIVITMAFQSHKPVGRRPYVVNPANRQLRNGEGLAQAIARGAGEEYTAWCHQQVFFRPSQSLEDGEVMVCGPFQLSNQGYEGIVNIAMQNVPRGTGLEVQKAILLIYYRTLFHRTRELKIHNLVMSLIGVGAWDYDPVTSAWCFLEVFQEQPDDQFGVTLLIPGNTRGSMMLANSMRRAQMEVWPSDLRGGWSEVFEPLPGDGEPLKTIQQELTEAVQLFAMRKRHTWHGQGEARASQGDQNLWGGTTWPSAEHERRGQDMGQRAYQIPGPLPAQRAFMPLHVPQRTYESPDSSLLEDPHRLEEGKGHPGQWVPSEQPSQPPVGALNGLLRMKWPWTGTLGLQISQDRLAPAAVNQQQAVPLWLATPSGDMVRPAMVDQPPGGQLQSSSIPLESLLSPQHPWAFCDHHLLHLTRRSRTDPIQTWSMTQRALRQGQESHHGLPLRQNPSLDPVQFLGRGETSLEGTLLELETKRAKAIKVRPLSNEPPLRGQVFTTSTDLVWGPGIEDLSNNSEGELAGAEMGRMVQGYPVDWKTAGSLAKSPTTEMVLSKPDLSEPLKHAYLHSGYEAVREQALERDRALALAARAQPSQDLHMMRSEYSLSNYARTEGRLPSRLASTPVETSTPLRANIPTQRGLIPRNELYPRGGD